MKNLVCSISCSVLLLFVLSCNQKNELKKAPIKIDFSKTENETNKLSDIGVYPKNFKVAISAIISPREGFVYYKDLISFLEKDTNIPFKILQRKTYQEVNLMLRNKG